MVGGQLCFSHNCSRYRFGHLRSGAQLPEEEGELKLTVVVGPAQFAAHGLGDVVPERLARAEFDQEEVPAFALHGAARGAQQVGLSNALLPLQHQATGTRPGTGFRVQHTGVNLPLHREVQTIHVGR